MDLNSTLKAYQAKINEALLKFLPPITTQPSRLHQAIHYSMMAGGKRLRPTLLLMAYDLFSPSFQLEPIDPLPAAVAVECVHTSSLIHDDLPAMDDSHLRRGQPTCHKQFNEATAILAGDALLILPFHILAQYYATESTLLADLIQALAHASGSERLIGGQAQDLEAQQSEQSILAPTQYGKDTTRKSIGTSFLGEFREQACEDEAGGILIKEVEDLETISLNKTAALISASLYMGLRLVTDSVQALSAIKNLGEHLGIAFQIIDDVLDLTSTPAILGKETRDAALHKLTYPAVLGLETSKEKAIFHTEEALKIAKQIGGKNEALIAFIESLAHRNA